MDRNLNEMFPKSIAKEIIQLITTYYKCKLVKVNINESPSYRSIDIPSCKSLSAISAYYRQSEIRNVNKYGSGTGTIVSTRFKPILLKPYYLKKKDQSIPSMSSFYPYQSGQPFELQQQSQSMNPHFQQYQQSQNMTSYGYQHQHVQQSMVMSTTSFIQAPSMHEYEIDLTMNTSIPLCQNEHFEKIDYIDAFVTTESTLFGLP